MNPIYKRIIDEDTSDYSEEKILGRSIEDQAKYLGYLLFHIKERKDSLDSLVKSLKKMEEDRKKLNMETGVKFKPGSVVLEGAIKEIRREIRFTKQQISKIKKHLSDEDFKKVQEIAEANSLKLIKSNKLKNKMGIFVAVSVVVLIIMSIIIALTSESNDPLVCKSINGEKVCYRESQWEDISDNWEDSVRGLFD